jgi:peptidoglycan/LPS O-acetylase OafA/YrhL
MGYSVKIARDVRIHGVCFSRLFEVHAALEAVAHEPKPCTLHATGRTTVRFVPNYSHQNDMLRLSDFTYQRDNNLNLLRVVAALVVLIVHGFTLTLGAQAPVPFQSILGMPPSAIAVDIFFIVSGFLVTASLLRTENPIDYIWARILRIFPGILVMLVITVFGFGLLETTYSVSNYLTSSQTYRYFLKCATLFTGVEYNLPGLFENNAYKSAVNGSLWTVPIELKMYCVLLSIWLVSRFVAGNQQKVFKGVTVCAALMAGGYLFYQHFSIGATHQLSGLLFMFFTGASFFVLRKKIVLHRFIFLFLIIVLGASAYFNAHAFFLVYSLALAYVTFYIAYIPKGFIRKYNALGDYSYGIYIYSFPIQQLIIANMPNASVAEVIALSFVASMMFAIVSWHVLEKNALRLKKRCVARTEWLIAKLLPEVADGRQRNY